MSNSSIKFSVYFFLGFLFFGFTPTKAQNKIFHTITSMDGLPSTSVTHVTQDSEGFIYIGTWDGVFRYDGENFEQITFEGRYAYADEKGGIWISTGSGLAYYNSKSKSLKRYTLDQRYPEVIIRKNGDVFVGRSKEGLALYNPEADRFDSLPGQKPGDHYVVAGKEKGLIAFTHVAEGQNTATIGTLDENGNLLYEVFPQPPNDPDRSFYDDFFTEILPWENEGLVLINPKGFAKRKSPKEEWNFYLFSPEETDLIKGKDEYLLTESSIWINHPDRLIELDISTGELKVIEVDDSDPSGLRRMSSVHGCEMFLDQQGVLWIPRYAYGLSTLNLYASDFGLFRGTDGEVILDVLSAFELEDGSFWIGHRDSQTEGLKYFSADGKTLIRSLGASRQDPPGGKTISNTLSHPFPWAIHEGKDGTIWVGSGSPGAQNGGLNRIEPGWEEITIYRHDPEDSTSIPRNWVFRIFEDESGMIWVSTDQNVASFDPVNEQFESYRFGGESSDEGILLLDSKDQLLVGIDEDGVYSRFLFDIKTKNTKKLDLFGSDMNFYSFPVEDPSGRIWFATPEGFGYSDYKYEELFEWINFSDFNYPEMQIQSLSYDDEGNMWFGSNLGILKYNPETKSNVLFGFERGLQSRQFHPFLNHHGPSGKIYFSGAGGLNRFDPSGLLTNPIPPKMVFLNIKLNGEEVQFTEDSVSINFMERITISPDISSINIGFTALHFGAKESNKLEYQLEGFDQGWQSSGKSGNAIYTNLPPGEYTLRIRGANLDNIWSDGSKSLELIVLPPWYRTWWVYLLYFALFVLLAYGFVREQRKRATQKERELAKDRELAQAKEIEKAYSELKSTQAQLIQSEKMASLGELTAGIAHEIQNPLNFVNNFSELNRELIAELKEEIEKGDLEEVKLIANDIETNEEKINHHGKRAGDIVKGMLEHSRTSTGEKTPTDLNALTEEYLKLSYHGLRAKDKSFTADFSTDFDPDLPKVKVVSQDLGRVLLNLINNAFYAVNEKAKLALEDYKPEVIVSSRKTEKGIEISVQDNGSGIPDSIKEKIFQPFFTTKPTGSGTGLGLSLSYDIVKAHGGELRVESEEGEGTDFSIQLPLVL